MEAFFTIILLVALFFWLLGKFLPRILAWYVRRRIGVAPQEERWRRHGWRKADNENINEGEVEIKYSEPREKIITGNMGEYVDFEEEKSN